MKKTIMSLLLFLGVLSASAQAEQTIGILLCRAVDSTPWVRASSAICCLPPHRLV